MNYNTDLREIKLGRQKPAMLFLEQLNLVIDAGKRLHYDEI